jgi:hypothetical protein
VLGSAEGILVLGCEWLSFSNLGGITMQHRLEKAQISDTKCLFGIVVFRSPA